MDDLVYALVQLAHNAGAAAVIVVPALALRAPRATPLSERRFGQLALAAWALPAATGAGFAWASYGLKGALPEIAGVALGALLLKMCCTTLGLGIAAVSLWRGGGWSTRARTGVWRAHLLLAVVALGAAAFLRWYL